MTGETGDPTNAPGDLRQRMLTGTRWSLISRLVTLGFQYLFSIAIARHLAPGDLGLVAMVNTFTGFAAVLADVGLGTAIIQRRNPTRALLSAAFAASMFLGALQTAIFLAGAGWIADFFGRPELVGLTRLAAWSFLFSSLGTVPRALLVQRIRTDYLALADIFGILLGGGVGTVLAVESYGAVAVVASTLVSTVTSSVVSAFACGWRPRLGLQVGELSALVGVSANMTGFNVLNYWARNVDNLMVGRLLGADQLGLYARAYGLMYLPISQLGALSGSVILPGLVNVHDDRPASRRLFLRVIGLISLVAFPVTAGLMVVAKPFLAVVYGSQWSGAAPILQVLLAVCMLQCIVSPTGAIYIAQGRTDTQLRWAIGACSIIIVALIAGAFCGSALAVALAYLCSYVVLVVPAINIPGRLIGMSARDVLRVVSRPGICTLVMAGAAHAVAYISGLAPASLPLLVAQAFVGAVVFAGLARSVCSESVADLLALVAPKRDAGGKGFAWTRAS